MNHIENLVTRYPQLKDCAPAIEKIICEIVSAYEKGGKILLCGNGGSAADCEHISGELLKGFLSKRKIGENEYPTLSPELKNSLQKAIPAIPLGSLSALYTAFCNDVSPELTFAQLVFAFGKKEDVFIGISTSGNAKNVAAAAETANALGIKTIALTGAKESKLSALCQITVQVPETETYKIQELHLPVYHAICAEVEHRVFEN